MITIIFVILLFYIFILLLKKVFLTCHMSWNVVKECAFRLKELCWQYNSVGGDVIRVSPSPINHSHCKTKKIVSRKLVRTSSRDAVYKLSLMSSVSPIIRQWKHGGGYFHGNEESVDELCTCRFKFHKQCELRQTSRQFRSRSLVEWLWYLEYWPIIVHRVYGFDRTFVNEA